MENLSDDALNYYLEVLMEANRQAVDKMVAEGVNFSLWPESEREIAQIQKFTDNKQMFEAVRKVVLDVLYQGTLKPGENANPRTNFTLRLVSLASTNDISTEKVGEELKVIWAGINLLEGAFDDMKKLKPKPDPKKKEGNQAR